jgi:hypothetical protein
MEAVGNCIANSQRMKPPQASLTPHGDSAPRMRTPARSSKKIVGVEESARLCARTGVALAPCISSSSPCSSSDFDSGSEFELDFDKIEWDRGPLRVCHLRPEGIVRELRHGRK